MEKLIFTDKNGLGLILTENEIESNYFENEILKVVDEILKPENETTLKDFFTKKVIYKGTLKNNKNCMVFYLGNEWNLFDNLKYYSCVYWITENRIVNKYSFLSARYFNWNGNEWK
jgi:hypothetical protein